jgi:RimJ/RimL family protein N-acetyltransferase
MRNERQVIVTDRLTLAPATVELTRAALDGPETLGAALGASVPKTPPPEYMDAPALEFTLRRLVDDPANAGWWLYFVLLRGGSTPLLIGSSGYKGPPSEDGTVEIGYGIVSDQRRADSLHRCPAEKRLPLHRRGLRARRHPLRAPPGGMEPGITWITIEI